MDILIKSFNRAYYLDRCLSSISKYLINFTGSIYILDDGTPCVYLKKIESKYPYVIIVKSNFYSEKSKLLESQNYNLPNKIPSSFWYDMASQVSDYFILLEDDMWFTKTIDASTLKAQCKKENVGLLKLFWVSNPKVIGDIAIKNLDDIILYKTNIQFKNPTVFKYVYRKHNKLWRKLLSVLRLYSREKELQYYTIYSVAGAVFKKDYFLSIWENANTYLNEKEQLTNAIVYSNKNEVSFGRTKTEILKTGFISSAFQKHTFSEFSIHDFNEVINAYWLLNDDLFCNDFDSDIDESDIKYILKGKDKSETYISQWQEWVLNFKGEFQKMGCNI